MSEVNASSADVRKLAAALKQYKEETKQVGRRVDGAIRSANWHDKNKDQFETRYRDFTRQIDRFMSTQVEDMVRSLNDLARKLEDIERMRM
ncbi:MAG TPA: hypothetical protein VK853_05460 [Ilumatobacteraceae bacterium]|nr:hypothetical protein [Ilumatobacteraceae bacterium]